MERADGKGHSKAAGLAVLVLSLIMTVLPLGDPGVAEMPTTIRWEDVNPDFSNNSNPTFGAGGRVNGLAGVPGDNDIFYAASEVGGLFKSTDGAASWRHLDGHLPTRAWDVEVDPSTPDRVYATSFYDGKVNSVSGIEVSTDGGVTWTHPATAVPPPALGCENPKDELAAFGIGIRPDDPSRIFVGTQCGLAISEDSGVTWRFVDADETPDRAARVWDVVAQPGGAEGEGIVDVCSDEGHFRSTDGGDTWTGGSGDLPSPPSTSPSGTHFLARHCSIAVSPDEPYVLFVYASDNSIYESDDAGETWTKLGTPEFGRQGRIPFVATNQRADEAGEDRFDLWGGDVLLYRATCTTPRSPAPRGALRCPMAHDKPQSPPPHGWETASGGQFRSDPGGHPDVGDIVFDTEDADRVDACPVLFSNDGGIYRNTNPDCQVPSWREADRGLHAMWLWAMDGVDRPGGLEEELYIGTQDNGAFGTVDAGAASPEWNDPDAGDTYDLAAQSGLVVRTKCCGGKTGLSRESPGLLGEDFVHQDQLPGKIASRLAPSDAYRFSPDAFDDFGDKRYALATTGGVHITNDVTVARPIWIPLGADPHPPGPFALQVAALAGTPTFYVHAQGERDARIFAVWKFTGTGAGAWDRVEGVFSLFSVDEGDPDRIAAATIDGTILFSTDGGATWTADPELDALIVGAGAFKYRRPTLLAFDPHDPDFLVAGGEDSGVFLSTNGGESWDLVTDPMGTSQVPHLPEPRFAYFDHEPDGRVVLFIGTRGRGVWRTEVRAAVADAGGPYETIEGTDVVLDAGGSRSPDGSALSYEWDLDADGVFDDATGTTATFGRVGQDTESVVVAVKVTTDEASFVDATTVTVRNVEPSVRELSSTSPVPEGSAARLDGTLADPGWLDGLTGTITWDVRMHDQVEPIVGMLENVRPDATLTFSATHIFDDNGDVTGLIRASDDDVTSLKNFFVRVDNVAPAVALDPVAAIDEGDFAEILASFSDPGWADTYGATIDWGTPAGDVDDPAALSVTTSGPPADQGEVTGTFQYGDNGLFDIEVDVTDDDNGTGSETVTLMVNNVDPTAVIDLAGSILINGTPTFLADSGELLSFTGNSTDPGSDDLTGSWDWGDGAPSPDVSTLYRVNDPFDDPPSLFDPNSSPSVQQRDVTDSKDHAFGDACQYTVEFASDDDDGGHANDSVNVIVTGNADQRRGDGYWKSQYGNNGNGGPMGPATGSPHGDFDEEELECLLLVVGFMSNGFDEQRDASTIAKALEVLDAQPRASMQRKLDRALLSAWLNFANGSIELTTLVDTNGDGIGDTTFGDVIAGAEAVRLDPGATNAAQEAQKNLLERINRGHA